MREKNKNKKKRLVKPISKSKKGVCLYGEGNSNCVGGC